MRLLAFFSTRMLIQQTSLPAYRAYVTFPHPDLDPQKGQTRFAIRVFNNIPSLLHAYTIIRAVELKMGVSVLHMRLPKQQDNLSLSPSIFIETLQPIQLDKPLLLEIPAPRISEGSNFLGGPSLSDVSAVLSSSPTASSTVSTSPPGGKNAPLQFTVEVQKGTGKESLRARIAKRAKPSQDRQNGVEVVQALQTFGGGFYGGFEGLAERFDWIIKKNKQ
ncbi:hypothetical protein L204_101947 [Cryptococcus depauperatus]|nr:hypothetical protein L204_05598 [Cryptococcus depauperatus CBS 7855]